MGLLSQDELQALAPAEIAAFPGPIPTQIVSSDEYFPSPQTARQREVDAIRSSAHCRPKQTPEGLTGKRLQLLTEALPGLKGVAVFWDDFSADQFKAAQTAARGLGVRVHPLRMRNPPYDFESAFRTVVQERPGALLGLAFPLLFRERSRVADLALKHRLPAIFSVHQYAEAGGLMSYGVSFRDMFRRAAEYVDQILKSARPGDMKTAKALGLVIPSSLLLRADRVIE